MLPIYLIKGTALQTKLKSMYLERAGQIYKRISPHVPPQGKILDIGCGTGSISKLVKRHKNSNITLVDVQYNPMCDDFPITIYDGENLPFPDNHFKTSFLITVLHHTQDHTRVIKEAARVTSDKIIVIEDVFTDILGRTITFVGDCLVNWEIHSPFTNHSAAEWNTIFKRQHLNVNHFEEFSLRCIGFPFKLALFTLSKNKK
jgi:ubiquinone/menaquinone biosynthesis C-methylase UbiE